MNAGRRRAWWVSLLWDAPGLFHQLELNYLVRAKGRPTLKEFVPAVTTQVPTMRDWVFTELPHGMALGGRKVCMCSSEIPLELAADIYKQGLVPFITLD